MLVELDKSDLISLVKGQDPSYELMEHPLIKDHGSFTGGFKDEWNWNRTAYEESPDDLILAVYWILKNER